MTPKPLTPAQARRALALIEKGHLLEGKQIDPESLDRARRILVGELRTDDAREEIWNELRALVSRQTVRDLPAE